MWLGALPEQQPRVLSGLFPGELHQGHSAPCQVKQLWLQGGFWGPGLLPSLLTKLAAPGDKEQLACPQHSAQTSQLPTAPG